MTDQDFPSEIEVYEIGARRLYVKTGVQGFAIWEDELTPRELVAIAKDILERQAKRSEPQIEMAAA